MKVIISLSLSALCITPASSFTVVPVSIAPTTKPATATTTATTLNLVPSQGCQLAAASAAALAKKKEAKLNNNNHEQQQPQQSSSSSSNSFNPTDATREFVSRIFQLPFTNESTNSKIESFHHKNKNNNQGSHNNNDHNDNDNDDEDAVLFPIVGFQYVKLQDGSIRGIPTINAAPEKAVCNFGAMNLSVQQPVHGWFSQCCTLGSLFDDDDVYCGNARRLKLEEKNSSDCISTTSSSSTTSNTKAHP